jgi:hypothetical protein
MILLLKIGISLLLAWVAGYYFRFLLPKFPAIISRLTVFPRGGKGSFIDILRQYPQANHQANPPFGEQVFT